MKLLTLLLPILLACYALADCASTRMPGDHTIHVSVGSKNRKFLLYVPMSLNDTAAAKPVVFLYHGYAGDPQGISGFTQIRDFAEEYGWYAVMPFGSGIIKSWNGAGCCGGNTANDVGFAIAIADWLKSAEDICVDGDKLFVTGFSNGGFMTHRLACEASETFAAFAPHSGLMSFDYAASCDPGNSVPILSLHGTEDGVVPYFGNGKWVDFWSLQSEWSAHNGCVEDDNTVTYKSASTKCVLYHNCLGGVPVEFCEVSGLDHHWSGSVDDRSEDVDATEQIFKFFSNVGVWGDKRRAMGLQA